ncbi:MAG: SH3 domain-containing protein, partial [Bacteroidota bacterium]
EEIQQFEVKNPLPKWPAKRDFREYKLYPFDEAVNDESLLRFRQQLYEAVKRRNVSHLLASCSDKIKFSFGMENGKSAFIESWKLDKPQADTSGIWTELENVLSLGGAFIDPDKEVFLAPYQSVVDDFTDPFSEGVITGENVRLRDQPSVEGKIIASLSWDKVSIIFQDNAKSETIGGQTHYWEKVRNAKEQIGYVWGKYLGYSAGYRAAFEKEEGEWKMVTFIAGD